MLRPSVQLGDDLPASGKMHGVRGDQFQRFGRHDRLHLGAMPYQLAGQIEAFHRGDAAGDAQHDALAFKEPALGRADALRGMHEATFPPCELRFVHYWGASLTIAHTASATSSSGNDASMST